MQNANVVLNVIRERGERDLPLQRLYRQLGNRDLYLLAYANLYSNKGAMTKGVTEETADGMSLAKIDSLIDEIKHERFKWTPVRRVYIPKANGDQRPLGLPTWRDKLVQEVIRLLLDAYYEPNFSPNSHGFRPERGCHTALESIRYTYLGSKWFIEGDISRCFDTLNSDVLISILKTRIDDGRFIRLIRELLQAGYMEDWKWHATLSGTPQGGVVSPLLSNIYLDRLDKFVETELIPAYTRGKARKTNPVWNHWRHKKGLAKRNDDRKAFKTAVNMMRSFPSLDPYDPALRRLRYTRYADDFVLGFAGPKEEAVVIKQALADFMQRELKLELSKTKTLITHAATERARFLGHDLHTQYSNTKLSKMKARSINGQIALTLPKDHLRQMCARYERNGKPIHRPELILNSDFDIIARYQSEYRGYVQYYALARNLCEMNRLRWVMATSLLKTLANKYKSTVNQMVRKYQKTVDGYKVLVVEVPREGKVPLKASFGGVPLKRRRWVTKITDEVVTLGGNRNELLQRLLADTCELCGSQKDVEVHHIRKLADLNKPGRSPRPLWVERMAKLRRKTLIVCASCHRDIHRGSPQVR